MEIALTPEMLIGPVGGLIVSLYFSVSLLKDNKQMMERLVTAFEQEVKACEERYKQVLDELLKMKDDK